MRLVLYAELSERKTRMFKGHLPEMACGFKSHIPHHRAHNIWPWESNHISSYSNLYKKKYAFITNKQKSLGCQKKGEEKVWREEF